MAPSLQSHREHSAGRHSGESEESLADEFTSPSARRFHSFRGFRQRSFRQIDCNTERIGMRKTGLQREPEGAPGFAPTPIFPARDLPEPACCAAFPWSEVQTGQNQIVIFRCVWYRFHLRQFAVWRSRRCCSPDDLFVSPFASFKKPFRSGWLIACRQVR